MKKLLLLTGLLLAFALPARAAEIFYFDFNTDDSNAATGTLNSRPGGSTGTTTDDGSGTIAVIGGATYTFANSANDDPRLYEQSALRTTGYPGTASANKTAGIECRFSTVGYEGITVRYQHNNSGNGSRYWRVRYTPNGSTWIDHQVIVNATSGWHYFDIDFGGIPAADNNPNFGFRIVAEWESTAIGKGTAGYVASTSASYSTGGTFWLDIITVSGNPIDNSNTRPTISAIPTQETIVGVPTAAIPFTVGDAQEPAGNLDVQWSTVGTDLVDSVVLGGSGANRTITIAPTTVPGTATITLKVTDSGGKYITTRFPVNIRPTPPQGAIAYFDFNSPEQDGNPATGSYLSRVGSGTAQVVVANHIFAGSSSSLDPWTVDNSSVRMNGFPAATVGNKTAGIEFRFSTAGYEAITLQYDHNNGNTGSRYYRSQYTADGVNWVDHVAITNAAAGWFVYTVDFRGIRAADNNPNFGARIVSEFESTATGTGTNAYVESQSNALGYTTSGTFWVDRVTFTAEPLNPANTAPILTAPSAITNRATAALIEIPFTVGDAETPAANLAVAWSTPTPTLIAGGNLTGSGANRTLTVVPSGQEGTAELVIRVTDAGDKYTDGRIALELLPPNTAPTIAPIPHQQGLFNTTINVPITVNDLETSPNALLITATSTHGELLPEANFVVSGSGSAKTLHITPAPNRGGAALVTVSVSDGELASSTSFAMKVVRAHTLALWDFNSNPPDGTVTTGSYEPAVGAGTFVAVGTATNSLGGPASITDPAPEDNSSLRLGSFPDQGTGNKTSGAQFSVDTTGYQDISMTWDHWNSASGSRYWRIQYTLDGSMFIDHIVHTNTVPVTSWPSGADFSDIPGAGNNPNFAVRMVAEFESTAVGSELEAYVGAQASGNYTTGGTLWLDMVTFTAEPVSAVGPSLVIVRNGAAVEISWPASAPGVLESTGSLTTPNWQPVSEAPVIAGDWKTVSVPATGGARFFRLRD
jgi:hypothetical protein